MRPGARRLFFFGDGGTFSPAKLFKRAEELERRMTNDEQKAKGAKNPLGFSPKARLSKFFNCLFRSSSTNRSETPKEARSQKVGAESQKPLE
jgi:hypothetical protein